jgi:hypothetical protein
MAITEKIMQGWLSFLCPTPLLSKIYPPMKFPVDTSNTFEISSGQNRMKKNKGQ